MQHTSSRAPVAIFVYNRLKNTRAVIDALRANYLAKETDVYIFADGAKNQQAEASVSEVRAYLKTITGFKSVTIIEREENYYIERNVIDGVTRVVNEHGRIIVLEDDGVTAPYFLTFMNDALDFYDKHKKIMHIGTFTFINMPNENEGRSIIWPYVENTGGGWGTWKDRWEKFTWLKSEEEGLSGLTAEQKERIEFGGDFRCLGMLKLKPITWDISWFVAITRNDGLCVNSPVSLTVNNGLYNGTHFNFFTKLAGKSPFEVELSKREQFIFDDNIVVNEKAVLLLRKFYRELGQDWRTKLVGMIIRPFVVLRITKLVKWLLRMQ